MLPLKISITTLRNLKSVLLCAVLLLPLTGRAQSIEKNYLKRIMTYNIHGVRGMDEKIDYDRTAKVIKDQDADFVAIQELDSACTRSAGAYQLEELAKLTLLYPTFGPSIDFQGGKYGIGILSKEKPLKTWRIALPGKEPRSLLLAEFDNVVFCCTHLALEEENRLKDMDIILSELRKCTKPVVICGDWNDVPESKLLQKVKTELNILSNTDTKTFPASKPDETIDYIAASKGVIRLSCKVLKEPVASDHNPIVVDLRLKAPASQLMTCAPYLQDPRPDAMTVMFQTNIPCHCWVEYGTDSLHTQKMRTLVDGQELCYDIENKIVLKDLKPATTYFYRVVCVDILMKRAYEYHMGDTLKTCFHSFRTPSDMGKDFTCLVFNDLHEQTSTFNLLRNLVKDVNYDFVIFNGDCLPEPRDRAHAISMIHKLADAMDGADKPLIFIRGNHEIRNTYSAGMHSLIGYRNNKTYGAFNWGDTRIMVLDEGEDKPDSHWAYGGFNDFTSLRLDEQTFINRELKSPEFKKAKRRLLFCHIPIWGNGDSYCPSETMWAPLLAKKPFDLALFAHTHVFKFYQKQEKGTSFPIYNGGGPKPGDATVAVLKKAGDKLHLKVFSQNPKLCMDADL